MCECAWLEMDVVALAAPVEKPGEQGGRCQTWGESTFNDSESDSGRLFDSESESDSSQFGYDSESNSDSSNISISDSESDSNFQLLI